MMILKTLLVLSLTQTCPDQLKADTSLIKAYQLEEPGLAKAEIELRLKTLKAQLNRANEVSELGEAVRNSPPSVISLLAFELIREVETEWTLTYRQEAATFLEFLIQLRAYFLWQLKYDDLRPYLTHVFEASSTREQQLAFIDWRDQVRLREYQTQKDLVSIMKTLSEWLERFAKTNHQATSGFLDLARASVNILAIQRHQVRCAYADGVFGCAEAQTEFRCDEKHQLPILHSRPDHKCNCWKAAVDAGSVRLKQRLQALIDQNLVTIENLR